MSQASFLELVRQVRCGDEQAARTLVESYAPHVRRVVRMRLTDQALRRQMDSLDICQSVLGDFFVRMALGQFELNDPDELVRLLSTLARNKLINHAEKQHAARRDVRRLQAVDVDGLAAPADEETPSQIVASRELVAEFRARLSDDERRLADERAAGKSWNELAAAWQAPADTLRMRLARALDRVAGELGLEEAGDV